MKMYLSGYQRDIGIGWKQYQLNDTDTGQDFKVTLGNFSVWEILFLLKYCEILVITVIFVRGRHRFNAVTLSKYECAIEKC